MGKSIHHILARHEALLGVLAETGEGRIDHLARHLDVSEATVRRDLDLLASMGMVHRTRGGATYIGNHTPVNSATGITQSGQHPDMESRLEDNLSGKLAIAKEVGKLVKAEQTIILDGGSTVYHAAMHIQARPLQIVTNSLAIAQLFKDEPKIELILVGGNLYPRTEVLVGNLAMTSLDNLNADIALLSSAGIDRDGVYNINMDMAAVEKQMVHRAKVSALLMDSSKFGKKSLVKMCSLDAITTIIGDENTDPKWKRFFKDKLHITAP